MHITALEYDKQWQDEEKKHEHIETQLIDQYKYLLKKNKNNESLQAVIDEFRMDFNDKIVLWKSQIHALEDTKNYLDYISNDGELIKERQRINQEINILRRKIRKYSKIL